WASSLSASTKSSGMLIGIYDEGVTLYGNPAQTFPVFRTLRAQVIRLNLHWGGTLGVAKRRPTSATDPNDAAYDWGPYDRAVQSASKYRMQVLFAIVDTPSWANGGVGRNHIPRSMTDL